LLVYHLQNYNFIVTKTVYLGLSSKIYLPATQSSKNIKKEKTFEDSCTPAQTKERIVILADVKLFPYFSRYSFLFLTFNLCDY